jgi:hypothetical protein
MATNIREFTVLQRRANMIDIATPKRVGVQGYRLKAALNFDLAFQTLLTADISSGYLDNTALRNGNIRREYLSLSSGSRVRIVFDPATFSGAPHNLADENHIWLQFFPVDFSGAEGAGGARTLILPPDEMMSDGRVIISGDAPTGASVVNSRRLDMPLRMGDVYVRNNEASGGTDLYIATAEGGPERPVAPQEEARFTEGATGTLLVRGGGGTANFTATMTHYLPL